MRRIRMPHCLFGMALLAVIFLVAVGVNGQTPLPEPSPTPNAAATPTLESRFFKNILHDQKAIWTSPFRLHRSNARWLAPLALGTGALITTDRMTGDEIGEFHAQLKPSRIVSYAGSTFATSGIAASFYFIGRATRNERARETGLLSAEALIDSLI